MKMSVEDYIFWLKEREAKENLVNMCARQKAKRINKKISNMIGNLK